MLLRIHNLPSHTRYVDIQTLIRSNCGIQDVILDQLDNEGRFKKVTVGLAHEEDAAIVMRHLNGLYVDGERLCVEDLRRKKVVEQPFHPVCEMNTNQYMHNASSSSDRSNPAQMYAQDYQQMVPDMQYQYPNVAYMMPNMVNPYMAAPVADNMFYNGQNPAMNENREQTSAPYYQQNVEHSYKPPIQQNKPLPEADSNRRPYYETRADNGEYSRNHGNPQSSDRGNASSYRSRSPRRPEPDNMDYDSRRGRRSYERTSPGPSRKRRRPDDERQGSYHSNNEPAYLNRYGNQPATSPPNQRRQREPDPYKWRKQPSPKRFAVEPRNDRGPRFSNDSPRQPPANKDVKKPQPRPLLPSFTRPKAQGIKGFPQCNQYAKMLRRDKTTRQQTACELGNDILCQYMSNLDEGYQKVSKALKAAIYTRIEILMGDDMDVPPKDIVTRYRAKFRDVQDKQFFDVIFESVQKNPEQAAELASLLTGPNNTKPDQAQQTGKAQQPNTAQQPIQAQQPMQAQQLQAPINNQPKPAKQKKQKPQTEKSFRSDQKKQAKLEYESEDLYTLKPDMQEVLQAEINAIADIYKNGLSVTANADEEKVVADIRQPGEATLRKCIKLMVTKRILNICTNLVVRIFVHGRFPKKQELAAFLVKMGLTHVRKAMGNKVSYVGTCETFELYDKLCFMKPAKMNDETAVSFKPLHITGPKRTYKRIDILKNRQEFIKSKINTKDDEMEEMQEMEYEEENYEELGDDKDEGGTDNLVDTV